MKTHVSKSLSTASSNESSVLSDILKYPEAKVSSKAKRKPAVNSGAVCLSDSPVVRLLKDKEEEKKEAMEEKARKKEERERKKEERERNKVLKEKEKEKKKEERDRKRLLREQEKTETKRAIGKPME
ncbi:MAG: hypothetical protein A6F71_09270 [Cycloclasticus sp. symbiont of Poecilosclerida sp. M]|nr:MAG: hypothetical protein A6F71_09270 [Cycloclasticus sp. symbiont of Poecilosclerida sp. M]